MTATLALAIPEATKPFGVEILRAVRRQVVLDTVRIHYSFLNEKVKVEPHPWKGRVGVGMVENSPDTA